MGFKVSVVPFHMWTPDVYEGAPTPIAGFFSVGPKAAGFSAILHDLRDGVRGHLRHVERRCSSCSRSSPWLVGNLFALVQKNVKRMLAYSSIAHVGYLLAGLAALGKAATRWPGRPSCSTWSPTPS